MNQENFNDAVYKDEEIPLDRKIELLEMCRAVYKDLSVVRKAEMLHLITSAQLFVLYNFKDGKTDE